MSYSVKEIFYTLQGEGAQAGRAAVFCRFAGCNLWTGLEANRGEAICQFCDTDFVGIDGLGGGKFETATELARAIAKAWPTAAAASASDPTEIGADRAGGRVLPGRPYVVFTGGEPLLQMDSTLVAACHEAGFEVAVETNGTRLAPAGVDWICVSPKAGAPLVQTCGQELKLVYLQPGAEPERYCDLDFQHFFLQPMDGPELEQNLRATVEYCLRDPRWRISLQIQKILRIP
ncbi:MAG: 7-carboxy-7-deazaguanine synthase [Planctomycetaceae bacterium]|nr:MAG: 7-carboxy-7-deazaguanine synthase [Planctomycetaceae bacterium]